MPTWYLLMRHRRLGPKARLFYSSSDLSTDEVLTLQKALDGLFDKDLTDYSFEIVNADDLPMHEQLMLKQRWREEKENTIDVHNWLRIDPKPIDQVLLQRAHERAKEIENDIVRVKAKSDTNQKSPTNHTSPTTPPHSDGSDNATSRSSPLRKPTKRDFQVWHARRVTGIENQTELAKHLTRGGIPIDQGSVSRSLNNVEQYINGGGQPPDLSELNEKPTSMDPSKIGIGQRQDRRESRQRGKRDPDDN